MKLQVLSDLHLEFHKDGGQSFLDGIEVQADVLVVAGDLDTELGGLEQSPHELCTRWRDVVYVFGNHELYKSTFPAVRHTLGHLRKVLKNLHVLDNCAAVLDGQRFVGTTLWFPKDEAMQVHKRALADFRLIAEFEKRVYRENGKSVYFLEGTVAPGDVVVTHHIPARVGVPMAYRTASLNPFFLCDLTSLITARRPALWIYGHTHKTMDVELHETRLVCNPVGYPFEVTGFDKALVVEP